MAATFRAFIGDDLAAKKVGEYHVELMHRGLDHAGVDLATEWAAPSAEPHEAHLMMALYENHARWRLDVVARCGARSTPRPRPRRRMRRQGGRPQRPHQNILLIRPALK